MKALVIAASLMFGFAAASAHAQAPAGAPAGTTGLCKDGTYSSSESKKGACRGHKGVKAWYAAAVAAPAAPAMPAPVAQPRAAKPAGTTATAAAPAGATGLCKDGSYYSGANKKGACRGHKGVKEWYGATAAAPAASAAPAKPARTTATAAAPAEATGLCKDGSYYSGANKKGACRGHKGVKEWYGATEAARAAPAMPAKPAMPPAANPAAPANPAMPANPAAPSPMRPAPPMATAPASSPAAASPASRTAAPGGGAGQVWVNTESRVYHCANDRYYGKTKKGEYMSEADAIAKGNHASHGKACAQ